jgi:hypothetical protein
MKLNLLLKLVEEELVWVPVIVFCKISFPVTHLMAYYVETGRSCPLVTTWLHQDFTDNFIVSSLSHLETSGMNNDNS